MMQYSSSVTSSPTSSSRASGSGFYHSTNLPTTPKSTGNPRHQGGQHQTPRVQTASQPRQRKAQSSSPQTLVAFASSSICSSPSARNVPLPPIEWLNQLQVPGDQPSRPSSSISNTSCNSSSNSSIASTSSSSGVMYTSSSPISSTPSSPVSRQFQEKSTQESRREIAGYRVCPLQLIAAVASA